MATLAAAISNFTRCMRDINNKWHICLTNHLYNSDDLYTSSKQILI